MAPSMNSLLLVAVLAVAAAVGPHVAEAASSSPVGLVTGIVPCSTGSSSNVAAVPVFPNADVQLVCNGKVVATATTDRNGSFVLNAGNLNPAILMAVINGKCQVNVTSSLSECGGSMAGVTGTLTAPVKLLASSGSGGGGLGGIIGLITAIIRGLLGDIIPMVTSAFSLVQNLG